MNKTFTSGRDLFGYFFWWGLLVAVLAFLYYRRSGSEIIPTPNVLGVMAFCFVLWLWLFLTTKYILTDEFLIVKCLMFTEKIKIDSITSVERTYSPFSAPAISIKRLDITIKNRRYVAMISPTPEKEFLKLIKELNPNIEIKV